MKYSTKEYEKTRYLMIGVIVFLILVVGILWYCAERAGAEGRTATCWALCKPGAQVMVRATPGKNGTVVGYLEAGDPFQTDGESKDGWIRAYGIGDGGGWVYSGYVATEKPQEVFDTYVCCAPNRAACRRWCGGPQIEGKTGWIYNGTDVQVFYWTEDWCVTSRGYIKSEWLEADPQ